MKAVLSFSICLMYSMLFGYSQVNAQKNDYEIKVVSAHMQDVKGILQKVNADGLAIADYKGNYLIFKAADIIKVKIKKRGLTTLKGAGAGALAGVVASAAIFSLEDEGFQVSGDTFKLTALITVGAALAGTVTGIVAEIANTKVNLYINRDTSRFANKYKSLEKYVRIVNTEHF